MHYPKPLRVGLPLRAALGLVRSGFLAVGFHTALDLGAGGSRHTPLRRAYLASRQLSPVPMSTTSGTVNWHTPSISRFTILDTASNSSGGHSRPIRRAPGAASRSHARPKTVS